MELTVKSKSIQHRVLKVREGRDSKLIFIFTVIFAIIKVLCQQCEEERRTEVVLTTQER